MGSSNDLQNRCFREWMNIQERDLSELLETLNGEEEHDDNKLRSLLQKNMESFQEYVRKRNQLATGDVSPYFAPNWCSALEGSMMWLGGCRPSMFIRLLFALIGKDIESRLEDYLRGERDGRLGEVSASQMNMINNLQRVVVKKEDQLSAKMTGLQEDISDQPIALIATDDTTSIREENREADEALDDHAKVTVQLMEEADMLRLDILKEILFSVLSPLQGVEFLAASKKLHLCIRHWGGIRDDKQGRPTKN